MVHILHHTVFSFIHCFTFEIMYISLTAMYNKHREFYNKPPLLEASNNIPLSGISLTDPSFFYSPFCSYLGIFSISKTCNSLDPYRAVLYTLWRFQVSSLFKNLIYNTSHNWKLNTWGSSSHKDRLPWICKSVWCLGLATTMQCDRSKMLPRLH